MKLLHLQFNDKKRIIAFSFLKYLINKKDTNRINPALLDQTCMKLTKLTNFFTDPP